MSTTAKLVKKYGNPTIDPLSFERKHMISFDIPNDINAAIPALPNRIYCNKDLAKPLEKVLRALIEQGLHKEIKTWDGCFNIRKQRGSSVISTHAFGMAIDMNAAHNPFRHTREQCIAKGLIPFTKEFVAVWEKNGWTSLPSDLMHFQYTSQL